MSADNAKIKVEITPHEQLEIFQINRHFMGILLPTLTHYWTGNRVDWK